MAPDNMSFLLMLSPGQCYYSMDAIETTVIIFTSMPKEKREIKRTIVNKHTNNKKENNKHTYNIKKNNRRDGIVVRIIINCIT